MRTPTPIAQTEKEFQQQVVDLARWRGWRVYHTWTSVHSAGGYPDLTLVRDGRLVFAEIKGPKGKVSPEQEEWLEELDKAGAESFVWRPEMWDEIEKVLR